MRELTSQEITEEKQKARFNNMSKSQKESFLQSLIQKDKLSPEVAQRVYERFESGQAGTVEEALNLIHELDTPSHYSDH
ncbi:TPA: hypothetical protein DIU27_02775 [Candidatus Collierbacteria bacterium]|uniref:Uncharacterized protein n=1 Tax=Candidatus Collierbacteria bacterium GW2011_GWB2_44_22 TaxID=1618387 RepID=A0A0G1HYG1_9BACT|nr:MAG: hypothetical protein UW31_C0001G0052 [Candidatus Collierbacteria bacterium GW2011_GWA2_44_13]KKT52181.1 MAG: hypothetical protein UW44_C0003G0024 [Candidatus Collierbacteria bacterium GW2011_GWB2_44_22]KKT62345.1 MAG: hypothetical protein UW56_C0008G0024 [Candidatus Collierbacteria bacterium GW2011_GWD1_44_27]KKT65894.1 MAG: hypothetical protein UW58_C0017G0026 [Candidatus Collierbacteria bacterium GW2011_GWC2_44_30]KKT68635.1 MAG: hypothetical protein UW64_C0014G0024 [Microgenomates gr